jgi:hypothetical protein
MVIKSEELDVTNNIQDYARHADWIRSFLGIWFPGSILRGRMLFAQGDSTKVEQVTIPDHRNDHE